MDSFDDMFALSDEELPLSETKCNPMEEHLMKQFSDVQSRIEKTTSDIKDVQDTTKRVLKSLRCQAQYGENVTSDSDSDLYTIDGQPVVKKKKHGIRKHNQILVVQSNWQRIIYNKWIIGIDLLNASTEILYNLTVYTAINGCDEISGSSMIWHLMDGTFWCRTDTIQSRQRVVGTVILDLPTFDNVSFCDAYGTVSYQLDEKQYQTPFPIVRLLVEETITDSCELKFSVDVDHSILALKSTSKEKLVGIPIHGNPERGERLLKFLEEKCFKEICADVYIGKKTGCLMYCLIEILPIVDGEARLRIFSRSNSQMNIILGLLRKQFPDATTVENNYVDAAMALIEELKLYLEDGSIPEKQRARMRTDLLIS